MTEIQRVLLVDVLSHGGKWTRDIFKAEDILRRDGSRSTLPANARDAIFSGMVNNSNSRLLWIRSTAKERPKV